MPVPLSPTQTDMLIQHLLDPDDLGEHCLFGWEIEGDLDLTALGLAIDHLHRRHQALHAAYRLDAEPVAEPVDVASPGLTTGTARSLEEARRLLRRALIEPFRLEDAVVWRAASVKEITSGRHLLGIAAHHIAVDGWSEVILTEDLSRSYNALLAGAGVDEERAPGLAEIADERRTDDDLELRDRRCRYWRTELADSPQLEYPHARDPQPDSAAALLETPLSARTFLRVQQRARAHRVTPYVVLLTAYARAVAEITGQHDICIGTPVAVRGEPGLDRAVSCLIDLLCLRLRFDRDSAPEDDLRRVSATVSRAFDARGIPLREIAKMVHPRRNGRPPLFQNVFALQNIAPAPLTLGDTRARPFRPPPPALPTELFVEVWQHRPVGPLLAVHYQPASVPTAFVRDLAECMLVRVDTESDWPAGESLP